MRLKAASSKTILHSASCTLTQQKWFLVQVQAVQARMAVMVAVSTPRQLPQRLPLSSFKPQAAIKTSNFFKLCLADAQVFKKVGQPLK
jgi:hypothetical protein